jgi:hypothetical protein
MRRIALLLILLACAVSPAAADHLLQFETGRTIVVSAWRIEGDWLYLELPRGAGSLVVSESLLFDARELDGPVGVVAWRRAPRLAPDAPGIEPARFEFARRVAERPDREPQPVETSARNAESR